MQTPTHTGPSQKSPQTGQITRQQLIELGQRNQPWAFIPIATRAIAQHPEDTALRILLIANLRDLGLATLAREHLAALPADAAADPTVTQLATSLTQLPDDTISLAARTATLKANLMVLRMRPPPSPPSPTSPHTKLDLRKHLDAWTAHTQSQLWFRTLTGDTVRYDQANHTFPLFAPVAQQAKSFVAQHSAPGGALTNPTAGIYLEGIDPPPLLRAIHAATNTPKLSFTPRIIIIQPDPIELLDALATADMTSLLRDDRLTIFTGDNTAHRFADWLTDHNHTQITGVHLPAATLRTPAEPSIKSVIERAVADQQATAESLKAQITERYAPRDRAHWAQRFADTTAGRATGTVLIPTCCYSTFIQHSARDIAAAFTSLGYTAHILIEPDNHSHLSTLTYHTAILEHDPDLIISINYPRQSLQGTFPDNVPYVCWIQDAMPHLFDESVGRAQTNLDFLAGHLHKELFERFGYPKSQSFATPVLVSEHIFNTGPLNDDLLEKYTCDVAYVSNHSESPDRMHERLRNEAAQSNHAVASVFDCLYPQLQALLDEPLMPEIPRAAPALVTQAFTCELGSEPDHRTHALITNTYAQPILDRLVRHRMLEWAADICDRHNWSLHIHGHGWSASDRFAKYASPAIPHNEHLCACYRAATVHLQGTAHWMFHQRLFECALSGGLPLMLLKQSDIRNLVSAVGVALDTANTPYTTDTFNDLPVRRYDPAAHPALEKLLSMLTRINHPLAETGQLRFAEHLFPQWHDLAANSGLPPSTPWLFNEPDAIAFRSQADLEHKLEHYITNPAARTTASTALASRIRDHLTYTSACSKLTHHIATALSP